MDKIGNIALLAIICTAVITVKQAEAGPCDSDPPPCQNGGTCTEDSTNTDGYTCACPQLFGGFTCEIDYCNNPNPCANGGTCGPNQSSANDRAWGCSCAAGWGGDTCGDQDGCNPNPCENGGTCRGPVTQGQAFACNCASGFVGLTCQNVAPPAGSWGF